MNESTVCLRANDDISVFFLIPGIERMACIGCRHHSGRDGRAAGVKFDGKVSWLAVIILLSAERGRAAGRRRDDAMEVGRSA